MPKNNYTIIMEFFPTKQIVFSIKKNIISIEYKKKCKSQPTKNVLTKHCNICGEYARWMRGHLAHVQTGIFLLHGIYVQPPIVRVLKFYLNPRITAVRIIANGQ